VKILRALYPIVVLKHLASDHRIRHGQTSVHSAEASQLHPHDSIHGSVSSTADWIPDFAESNYECSHDVPDWWTDCGVRQGYEGVSVFEPPGVLDDLFPIGGSSVQYDNPLMYINPCLLTRPEHEPLICSTSVISQSAPEALVQVTQSQSLLNSTLPESQRISTIAYTEAPSDKQELDSCNFYNSSFPVPPYSSPSQSASPTRNDQISSDTPHEKMEIVAARKRHVCQTCQRPFTTGHQYRNHVGVLGCHSRFDCNDCGRKFKNTKDLQRHRGETGAVSSCPKAKTVGTQFKPFACTCSPKAYTRKDSLQRHLRKYATDMPQQHRCRACNNAQCCCSRGRQR
jgi:hypothetical protein